MQVCPSWGLTCPESARQTLCDFGAAVIKQNEVMNLTAITQPDQVAKLHLLDSLTVLTAADLRGKQIIDVGCGRGISRRAAGHRLPGSARYPAG